MVQVCSEVAPAQSAATVGFVMSWATSVSARVMFSEDSCAVLLARALVEAPKGKNHTSGIIKTGPGALFHCGSIAFVSMS